jgi:hypothetical protein
LGFGASRLIVLIISFVILTGLSLWRLFRLKNVYIKKSFLVLLFFFAYVIFKIIVDIGDPGTLKAMTIATSGGFILFYAIGSMTGFTFNRIIDRARYRRNYFIILFLFYGVYIVIHSYYLLGTFTDFIPRLRREYFLISDIKGDYQRPASFLIISSMMLSSLYIHILLMSDNYHFIFKKIIFIFYFFICLMNLIFSMLLSQMIQSNNGLVCIGGILLISLFFHVYLFFLKSRKILKKYCFKFRNIIFGKIGKNIVLSGLITLVGFVIILLFSIKLIGIDVSTLRIGNYGEGRISSIETRHDINSAFFIHFFYSPETPIWGNMQVDTLTTGVGSYMHSFLLSILTHLGMFGLGIIVIFLYLSFKELLQKGVPGIYINGIKMYKTLSFCCFFIIANKAYFFNAISFWFLIGLFFSPMDIKR